jgi:CubicO group peptidase (beta-lactamase class C family)
MFRPVSFVVTALLVVTPTYAQDKTGEVDKIFSWATPATPGCAVAVSQHGKLVVNRAYGSAELEHGAAFSPGTISEPGSIAKQFTAAAVLLLVEDGRISLSDDVRKHIPELPDYGHKITVDHLLSHTSGIRDWGPLVAQAGAPRRRTVYGNNDALYVILRQRGLNFAPGEEFSYSNSGYVLLVEIIARKSGMSFVEFTRKRLFEPLGMKKTDWRTDYRDVVKNRALAYEKEGESWKLAMPLENYIGGGGLLSTTGDLLIWNEALTSGRLGAFVTEKLQEPARLNNGRQIKYARGLIVDSYRGVKEVWHSGNAAGYHSWLSRYPEQGLSIAVLCNLGSVTATALAHSVIDQFLPAGTAGSKAPARVADGTVAAGLDLKSKAGLFVNELNGEPLLLVVNNGELRIPGGPALTAVTRDRFRNPSGDLFFMSQDEFELNFLSQDQFELKSMEGKTTRYRRAQPFAPTPAELQAFAGRYESDEVGSVYRLTVKENGLVMTLEHSPLGGAEFKPVYRDTFQRGLATLRFQRDTAGKVVAFDYSNPLLRNLRVTRLSERTSLR